MYELLVGTYGVAPSEYWGMTPGEVNRIIDNKRPSTVNGIPNDDFDRMAEKREELISQGIKVL